MDVEFGALVKEVIKGFWVVADRRGGMMEESYCVVLVIVNV